MVESALEARQAGRPGATAMPPWWLPLSYLDWAPLISITQQLGETEEMPSPGAQPAPENSPVSSQALLRDPGAPLGTAKNCPHRLQTSWQGLLLASSLPPIPHTLDCLFSPSGGCVHRTHRPCTSDQLDISFYIISAFSFKVSSSFKFEKYKKME